MKQPMRPAYRNAFRIYVLACIGIGVAMEAGKPHPDYFLGGFYGLVGWWIGPGIVAKGLADLFKLGDIGVPVMLGISAAFWLAFFKIARSGSQSRNPPRKQGRGGLVVDTTGYVVLPKLPPDFDYYRWPEKTTTRTTTVMEEEN